MTYLQLTLTVTTLWNSLSLISNTSPNTHMCMVENVFSFQMQDISFNATITRAYQWAISIHFTFSQPVSIRFSLILTSHLLLSCPSVCFPRDFTTKILYAFHISPMWDYQNRCHKQE